MLQLRSLENYIKFDYVKWVFRYLLAPPVWLALTFIVQQELHAAKIVGLLGGESYNGSVYYPYAGVLSQGLNPNNVLGDSIVNGGISNSALNQAGLGLVGGAGNGEAYAAFILPSNQVVPLSDLPIGSITRVSLNNLGNGVISGLSGSGQYLALVSLAAVPAQIPVPTGITMHAVSIGNSGRTLVGGNLSSASYLAEISSSGTLIPITLPATSFVTSISINNTGTALVSANSTDLYAAFVDIDNNITPVNLPVASGAIDAVSINNFNNGLVAGYKGDYSYAAFVAANGNVSEILGASVGGGSVFSSVSINNANAGLVGGYSVSAGAHYPLAFLVLPNGQTISLDVPQTFSGEIDSVSINQAGIGLIGGFTTDANANTLNYGALIAPNGTVVPLTIYTVPDPNGVIGISSATIIDAATPQSFGAYASAVYSQLAAASALETHFIKMNVKVNSNTASLALMASTDPCQAMQRERGDINPQNVFWAVPIFNYVHVQSQNYIPTYDNTVGGILLGYDRTMGNFLVGAGFGYAFNYAAYQQGLGHSKIDEELGCLYMIYHNDYVRTNAAIWGGGYQLRNERHMLAIATSYGKTHGWILSPHLEVAFPIGIKGHYRVEPFAMFDWVNNWQHSYAETGSSAFNLILGSLYNSLLQSEIGIRFYEQVQKQNGVFTFEQKFCYVNQVPFNVNSISTYFVGGAASAFPIATGSSVVQNLGDVQIFGSYFPNNTRYPYIALMAEAMLGFSYQSYFASLELGKRF